MFIYISFDPNVPRWVVNSAICWEQSSAVDYYTAAGLCVCWTDSE